MDIFYSDVRCGAGKTRMALDYILHEPGRYLVAVDKIDLIDERQDELRRLAAAKTITAPDQRAIHSRDGGHVLKQVRAAAFDFRDAEHVVVWITHAALQLSYLGDFDGWILIVDEIPTAWISQEFNNRTSFDWLDAHFELVPLAKGGNLSEIRLRDKLDYGRCLEDSMAFAMTNMVAKAKRGQAYANITSWDEARHRPWTFWSIWDSKDLAAFRFVVFLGHAFEESLLYKLWTRFWTGITWHRYELDPPPYAPREVCIQFFSERPATRYYFEDRDSRPLEHVAAWARANAGPTHFWSCNTRFADALNLPGLHITPRAHGTNHCRDRHECTILYAAQPSPSELRVLNQLGISRDEIVRAREYEDLIQFVMRSSLRDPASTEPVTIRVFSRSQAEFLATLIDGVRVEFVDLKLPGQTPHRRGPKPGAILVDGRERKPGGRKPIGDRAMTGAERIKRLRERRRAHEKAGEIPGFL